MAFPLWDTIKSYILGAWSWLDDPIEGLWDGFRAKILGAWTWLNTIDDRIAHGAMIMLKTYYSWADAPIEQLWDGFRAKILGAWTWLNTIDDRIRDTVSSRWSWLNTIDDRIRDIAWSHIAPKLGDWLWSFVVLEVSLVSKIGYRVLHSLWDMEWDDKNKEAK